MRPALPAMPCLAFLWFWANLSSSVSIPAAQTKVGGLALACPGPYCVLAALCMRCPVEVSKDTGAKNLFLGAGHLLG